MQAGLNKPLSLTFALHECRRFLRIARKPPRGYRLHALERKRAEMTKRLREGK